MISSNNLKVIFQQLELDIFGDQQQILFSFFQIWAYLSNYFWTLKNNLKVPNFSIFNYLMLELPFSRGKY